MDDTDPVNDTDTSDDDDYFDDDRHDAPEESVSSIFHRTSGKLLGLGFLPMNVYFKVGMMNGSLYFISSLEYFVNARIIRKDLNPNEPRLLVVDYSYTLELLPDLELEQLFFCTP